LEIIERYKIFFKKRLYLENIQAVIAIFIRSNQQWFLYLHTADR